MAWVETQTDIGNVGIGRCKYSVSLKHGGARISLPRSVVEQLKWTNKMRFKLLVGEGEVAGKLRLDVSSEGKITGRIASSGGGMLIRLGRWPKLAPRDVDTVSVDHEISNGSLIVTLPAHALAVAPPPRAAPPRRRSSARRQDRRHVQVLQRPESRQDRPAQRRAGWAMTTHGSPN